MIQQLGRHSSPLIVSGTTHTSTQYLSKHLAFTHSLLLHSLSSSWHTPPPPPPTPPSFPPFLPPSLDPLRILSDQRDTHGDRQKHFLSTRSHSLMSVNEDKNKHWTNMYNPVADVIAWRKRILEISVYVRDAVTLQPGSASPHKHKRISQSRWNSYRIKTCAGISVVLATWQTI